jgi:hypothetical protein
MSHRDTCWRGGPRAAALGFAAATVAALASPGAARADDLALASPRVARADDPALASPRVARADDPALAPLLVLRLPPLLVDPPDAERGPRAEDMPSPPAAPRPRPRRPSNDRANLAFDPMHQGSRASMGMTYRFFDHVDVGYSGLLGKTLGTEPHATAFAVLGALRPSVTAGMPVYTVKGRPRPGFHGTAGVEWMVVRHLGLFANVGGGYYGKALAKVEKSLFMPAAGFQIHL